MSWEMMLILNLLLEAWGLVHEIIIAMRLDKGGKVGYDCMPDCSRINHVIRAFGTGR